MPAFACRVAPVEHIRGGGSYDAFATRVNRPSALVARSEGAPDPHIPQPGGDQPGAGATHWTFLVSRAVSSFVAPDACIGSPDSEFERKKGRESAFTSNTE